MTIIFCILSFVVGIAIGIAAMSMLVKFETAEGRIDVDHDTEAVEVHLDPVDFTTRDKRRVILEINHEAIISHD